MTRWFIALASIGLLLGQMGARPPLSEAEFRASVQRLLADEPTHEYGRMSEFVQRHGEVAVPILVGAIRARWARRPIEDATIPILLTGGAKRGVTERPNKADGKAVGTIIELVDLATRLAEQHAIDAVGQLCSEYPAGCRCFIDQLFLNANSQQHFFTTASELARQYPELGDMTVADVEAALKSNGYGYAQELQERISNGDKIESDVILPRLTQASREKVMRALDSLNRGGQQAAPK